MRFLVCLGILFASSMAHSKELDLTKSPADTVILRDFSGKPDATGVLGRYTLQLPSYKRGVLYQGGWWPTGANRVYSRLVQPREDGLVDVPEIHYGNPNGGLFCLFEQTDGRYLAFLPLTGSQTYSWFELSGGKMVAREGRPKSLGQHDYLGGRLELCFGHHGTAAVAGDLPLCAWSTGKTPYEAAHDVFRQAAKLGEGRWKLRDEKPFPEPFQYLGWCSWDCIGMKCNEPWMLKALKGLDESPVPVRWALMDDGHYDKKTLLHDESDFPKSYAGLMKYRRPEKLRWLGIWYAMYGNFGGTQVHPSWDPIKDYYRVVNRRMMPKEDVESARVFFRYLFREADKHDFDLLKVDFETHNVKFFGGSNRGKPPVAGGPFPNPYTAAMNAQRGFHQVAGEDFKALINCNWHSAPCLFGSFDSVVGRCSEDNRGGEQDAITHTFHAFASTPWLGQIAWGDHDMFHSGDKSEKAAGFNAVAKAMSGGPVYLSEFAENIRHELVRPLCYEDGRLLRPLAPSTPLPEDIFHRLFEPRLFAAVSPLPHRAATFVIYGVNRQGPNATRKFSRTLTSKDYASAGGMVQPYPGPWAIPEDGLLVYDRQTGKAQPMKDGYTVELQGFDFRALQVSPVVGGCSVIGRTDKYLSASAISSLEYAENRIDVSMHESGPLGVWLRDGTPSASGVSLKEQGGGLFIAELPAKPGTVSLTISVQ
jgi:hypothetical protein